jgi:hypothetical protein
MFRGEEMHTEFWGGSERKYLEDRGKYGRPKIKLVLGECGVNA